MAFIWTLILTSVGGFILFAITSAMTSSPGRSLQRKFIALGDMRGMDKDTIIAAVGRPQSVSSTGDTGELLQWMATGYHISLIFDGGICQGVQSETAV